MKFQFPKEIYNANGKKVFDVRIGDETVKELEAFKRNTTKCNNCNHRHTCNQSIVYRRFDCQKNVDRVEGAYYVLTLLPVSTWAYIVFRFFEIAFMHKISLLLLSLTGFDIVCTLIEECVPQIYNWRFYLKVKKKLRIQRKEKRVEEAKNKAEEEAKIKDIPSYREIKNARTTIQAFRETFKQGNYGSNTAKLESCVECCEVIMQILEKSPLDYYRVSDVFEFHLPRVCTTMGLYKKAVEMSSITEEQEMLFEKFITATSEYLEKKKKESIYYNDLEEINLKSSADALKKSLQEENKG